ncbi:malonate transporter [Devosia sp. H5989]|nr:malonate transporter [Devosia sp. H5989]
MLAIFNVVIPVFAIVALGYGAVRFKLYPTEGVKGLVTFVNNFATPCLLFEAMLTADFSTTFNPAIIAPFYIGALTSLTVGTIIAIKVFKNRPGEGVASGFAAMFTNTVLIGIPIIQRAYGQEAMPVVYSIIAFHAPCLITIGMLVMELVRRDAAPLHKVLAVAGMRIVQNPLLWGVGLGLVGNLLHVKLPEPATAFVTMMAQAVLPAALFGLGGALNEYKISESWVQASAVSAFKLVFHPLIAYVLMVHVLHVPLEMARYGVLLAAMPTGINAYIFATYYNRGISVANSTILITTGLSIFTISGWLWLLGS